MNAKSYQKILSQLNFTKSNASLYKHILLDICLLGASYWIAQTGVVGQLAAALMLAGYMFRSFSLMHEAVHSVAHTQRRFNDWAGHVYGACSFLPYSQWKQIHLQHHLWAGNLEMDPTMKIIRAFRETGASPTRAQEFAWRWWLPYLAFRQQLVFWQKAFAELDAKSRPLVLAETVACLAFVGLCARLFGFLAIGVAVPAYLMLVELINFPHHTGLAQDVEGARLAPMDQHRIARSVIYMRWFNRYVLLNFNYHTEHHLFPTLPWSQLEIAHELVREELKDEINLSYGNEWLIASRKTTFREILVKSTERKLEKTKLVL